MKLTIRKKILLCSLVPLLLLGAIIILLASTLVRGSIIDQVKNSLKGTSIATLAAYDQNAGSYLEAENGDIWKGSYNISQSENLVDTIKSESGMDCSINCLIRYRLRVEPKVGRITAQIESTIPRFDIIT